MSRVLDREWKRASYERSKIGLCRWCGEDVKRFSTRRRSFCCDVCVEEYLIRSDSGYARKQVYKRDRGVCAQCGLDCSKWFSEFKRWLKTLCYLGYDIQAESIREAAVQHYFALKGVVYVPDWKHRNTFWDMDHANPVAKGGGSCGMENLRTLCVGCHRNETLKLNKELKIWYGYIAQENGVVRYVGIGRRGRWEHVNSGTSHNRMLNIYHQKGIQFEIESLELGEKKKAVEWEKEKISQYGRVWDNTGSLFNITSGGDGRDTCGGRVYFHDPVTNLERRVDLNQEEPPEGWFPGRSQNVRTHSCKGWFTITNGKDETRIPPQDPLPEGWWVGRRDKPALGRVWYTHKETKEQKLFLHDPGESWQAGRSYLKKRWFNNGSEELMAHEPPEGYQQGRLKGIPQNRSRGKKASLDQGKETASHGDQEENP